MNRNKLFLIVTFIIILSSITSSAASDVNDTVISEDYADNPIVTSTIHEEADEMEDSTYESTSLETFEDDYNVNSTLDENNNQPVTDNHSYINLSSNIGYDEVTFTAVVTNSNGELVNGGFVIFIANEDDFLYDHFNNMAINVTDGYAVLKISSDYFTGYWNDVPVYAQFIANPYYINSISNVVNLNTSYLRKIRQQVDTKTVLEAEVNDNNLYLQTIVTSLDDEVVDEGRIYFEFNDNPLTDNEDNIIYVNVTNSNAVLNIPLESFQDYNQSSFKIKAIYKRYEQYMGSTSNYICLNYTDDNYLLEYEEKHDTNTTLTAYCMDNYIYLSSVIISDSDRTINSPDALYFVINDDKTLKYSYYRTLYVNVTDSKAGIKIPYSYLNEYKNDTVNIKAVFNGEKFFESSVSENVELKLNRNSTTTQSKYNTHLNIIAFNIDENMTSILVHLTKDDGSWIRDNFDAYFILDDDEILKDEENNTIILKLYNGFNQIDIATRYLFNDNKTSTNIKAAINESRLYTASTSDNIQLNITGLDKPINVLHSYITQSVIDYARIDDENLYIKTNVLLKNSSTVKTGNVYYIVDDCILCDEEDIIYSNVMDGSSEAAIPLNKIFTENKTSAKIKAVFNTTIIDEEDENNTLSYFLPSLSDYIIIEENQSNINYHYYPNKIVNLTIDMDDNNVYLTVKLTSSTDETLNTDGIISFSVCNKVFRAKLEDNIAKISISKEFLLNHVHNSIINVSETMHFYEISTTYITENLNPPTKNMIINFTTSNYEKVNETINTTTSLTVNYYNNGASLKYIVQTETGDVIDNENNVFFILNGEEILTTSNINYVVKGDVQAVFKGIGQYLPSISNIVYINTWYLITNDTTQSGVTTINIETITTEDIIKNSSNNTELIPVTQNETEIVPKEITQIVIEEDNNDTSQNTTNTLDESNSSTTDNTINNQEDNNSNKQEDNTIVNTSIDNKTDTQKSDKINQNETIINNNENNTSTENPEEEYNEIKQETNTTEENNTVNDNKENMTETNNDNTNTPSNPETIKNNTIIDENITNNTSPDDDKTDINNTDTTYHELIESNNTKKIDNITEKINNENKTVEVLSDEENNNITENANETRDDNNKNNTINYIIISPKNDINITQDIHIIEENDNILPNEDILIIDMDKDNTINYNSSTYIKDDENIKTPIVINYNDKTYQDQENNSTIIEHTEDNPTYPVIDQIIESRNNNQTSQELLNNTKLLMENNTNSSSVGDEESIEDTYSINDFSQEIIESDTRIQLFESIVTGDADRKSHAITKKIPIDTSKKEHSNYMTILLILLTFIALIYGFRRQKKS